MSGYSWEKLKSEHRKNAKKLGLKFGNFGWVGTKDSILSKTDKGYFGTTYVGPGKYKNEFETYESIRKNGSKLMKKKTRKKVIRRKRRSMREKRVMRIKRGLMKSAKKLRLGAKRTGAYVYGTLRRIVGNPRFASLHPSDRAKLNRFSDYVNSFYGKGGVYARDFKNGGFDRKTIERAIMVYIDDVRKGKVEWGDGDSIDRERVRMILQPSYSMSIPKGATILRPNRRIGLRGNPMIEDREGYSTYRKAGFGNYQQWFEAGCPVKSTYMDSQGRVREKIKYTCSGKILPFPTSGGIRRNPPMYAHRMNSHRTHGLSLKQMMKLYRLVSSGNPKAVMYARRTLGIPMSESLSQVKAVVYHHVLDLKGKI